MLNYITRFVSVTFTISKLKRFLKHILNFTSRFVAPSSGYDIYDTSTSGSIAAVRTLYLSNSPTKHL